MADLTITTLNFTNMTYATPLTGLAKGVLKKHPVASFIGITFFITHLLNPVVVELVRIIFSGSSLSFPMGKSLLAQWGPTIGGLLMISWLYGPYGLRALLRHCRVKLNQLKWLMLACLLPLGMIGLSYVLAGIKLSQLISIMTEHWHVYLSVNGMLLLTAGLGEEIGWRGFLLPQLIKSRSVLSACLLLMLAHCLWHFNRFMGPADEPLHAWLPLFVGVTIIHIWLFFSSRGNLLVPILFHACFDAQHVFFSSYIPAKSLGSTPFHQGLTYVISYLLLGLLILLFSRGKLGYNVATFSVNAYFGSNKATEKTY